MDRPVDPDLPEFERGEPRFESLDEVFHEICARDGPEVLREVLSSWVEVSREDLEDAAAALEAAGKPSIAVIILEAAGNAPSGIDLDNPYEEGSLNWSVWRKSWLRKRRDALFPPEERLRRRKLHKQQQAPHSRH